MRHHFEMNLLSSLFSCLVLSSPSSSLFIFSRLVFFFSLDTSCLLLSSLVSSPPSFLLSLFPCLLFLCLSVSVSVRCCVVLCVGVHVVSCVVVCAVWREWCGALKTPCVHCSKRPRNVWCAVCVLCVVCVLHGGLRVLRCMMCCFLFSIPLFSTHGHVLEM